MDNNGIQVIQTEYNGYKFRSRLEARWAVFFDALGIKYEYEKEGYTLSNGERYLPDFYLPEYDVYIEIKPDTEHVYNTKAATLSKDTNKFVIVCAGYPYMEFEGLLNSEMKKIDYFLSCYFGGEMIDFTVHFDNTWLFFSKCRNCGSLCIGVYTDFINGSGYHLGKETSERCGERDAIVTNEMLQAFKKARQARFEYGEKG